jgi:hypothetical protein
MCTYRKNSIEFPLLLLLDYQLFYANFLWFLVCSVIPSKGKTNAFKNVIPCLYNEHISAEMKRTGNK